MLSVLGLSAIIFWSQSRSYILAMILIAVSTTVFYGVYLKIKARKVALYTLLGIVLINASFFLLPLEAQTYFVLGRMFGTSDIEAQKIVTAKKHKSVPQLGQTQHNGDHTLSLEKLTSVLKKDTRGKMWGFYLPVLINHPLGLGLNYPTKFVYHAPVIFVYPIEIVLPTFIFNVWALGGILATCCMCYLLWKSFLKLREDLKEPKNDFIPYRVGTFSALLIAWFVSLFYGLPLEYVGFWILSALALV